MEQVLKGNGIPYKIRNSYPVYVSSTESDNSDPFERRLSTSSRSSASVPLSNRTPLKPITPPYYKPPQKAELQSKFYRHRRNDVMCSAEDLIQGGEKIGQGTYGLVNQLGEVVKKRMDFLDEDDINDVNLKEICFLAQYSHGLISNIKCVEPLANNEVNLYMKFSGRTLDSKRQELIKNPNTLKFIIYQMLLLFDQLRQLGIRHGDIKGNNIVVDENYNVTVIDWGFVDLHPEHLTNKAATSAYRAPEVSTGSYFGPINDVFSFGMTIIYLYTQKFRSGGEFVTFYEKGQRVPDVENIPDIEIRELVYLMVTPNYQARISYFNQLLIHPMFNEFRQGRQYQRINSYQFHIRDINDVDPDYFAIQTDIDARMREILFDWLFIVCKRLKCKPAFSLCCYLVDLYLSQVVFLRTKLQLVGMACLYLASMMMSTGIAEAADFIHFSEFAYELQEFLDKILEISQQFNYIIYKARFDLEIQDVDYDIVKLLMLNNNGIGKSEDYHLQLYYQIQNNPQQVNRFVKIQRKDFIPKPFA